jgi:diguanylate cyclase (GGDEF)-like protein
MALFSGGEAAKLKEELTRVQEAMEGIRQDNGILKERVAELEGEGKDRAKLFVIMLDLARRLGENLSQDQVVALMLRMVSQLFESADEISIFLRDPGSNDLELVSSSGLPEGRFKGLRIPMGEGYIGHTAQKRIIMSAKDFEGESNIVKSRLQESKSSPLRSALVAPLIHGEELIGALNIGTLPQRVKDAKGLLLIICNLGAIALANARLFEELRSVDTLTGLYNRRILMERLEGEVTRARRFNHEVSLAVFDLDHFRDYNEAYGQEAGDEVLKTVGDILKNVIRKIDIVARYEDDVFAAVLVETSKDSGRQLAEKVRKLAADCPFPHGKLTFSAGLATFPGDASDPTALLEAALAASIQARDQGRNRVAVAGAG